LCYRLSYNNRFLRSIKLMKVLVVLNWRIISLYTSVTQHSYRISSSSFVVPTRPACKYLLIQAVRSIKTGRCLYSVMSCYKWSHSSLQLISITRRATLSTTIDKIYNSGLTQILQMCTAASNQVRMIFSNWFRSNSTCAEQIFPYEVLISSHYKLL
jgi:hypothetical protein